MKVISIKQPWATLILEGLKEYEFRSWKTKYRGELYIHASKNYDCKNIKRFEKLNLDFPVGMIIGKINLEDCIELTQNLEDNLIKESPLVYGHNKGREGYAWKLSNPEYINQIPTNGKLGIWEYKN